LADSSSAFIGRNTLEVIGAWVLPFDISTMRLRRMAAWYSL
jgi:hypothetical protein